MPDPTPYAPLPCRVAVIWIDWYPYHVARFRGLDSAPSLTGEVAGIELVGGIGVHAGLRFRENLPAHLAIETLEPTQGWREANKLRLAWKLWQALARLDPEVVLVPGYYTLPAIAAALWARLHGSASVLMTESCSMDHGRTGWRETVKGLGMRFLFGWAVTGGRLHVDYLRELGFPADRIVGFYDVVGNGFFARGTAALRATSTAAAHDLPDGPFFLYVGRMAEEKNVGGLLRSWFAYRAAGGTWPLVLVGDGPKLAGLRALASCSQHRDDVYFPGLRSSAELLPFLAFAGCFVLPSTREPWGLVVNEAMSSSLPVLVSTRCGCAPDLVEPGANGFTFDPTAPDAETVLTGLLTRIGSLPAGEREAMGRRSAEIVAGFSPERFGQAIASVAAASAAGPRTRLQPAPEAAR